MSTELSAHFALPSLTPEKDTLMTAIKERAQALPQVALKTHHVIHAGLYCRTVQIPAGIFIVGAKIIKPTLVTICGSARLFEGSIDQYTDISGYAVIPGEKNRRMLMLALTDVSLSMTFVTSATTVQEAEQEFTDEYEELLSHQNNNEIIITGET